MPILSRAAEEAPAPTAEAPAPAPPQRSDLRGLVADPGFQSYPLAERVAVLRKIGVPEGFIRAYSAQEEGPALAEGDSSPSLLSPGGASHYDVPLVRPEHFDPSTTEGRINSALAEAIIAAAESATITIAAWGAHGTLLSRGSRVIELLKDTDLRCVCLTQNGQPHHPRGLKDPWVMRSIR